MSTTQKQKFAARQKLLEMAGVVTEQLNESFNPDSLNPSITELDRYGVSAALANSGYEIGNSILAVKYSGATKCGQSLCHEHKYDILGRGDEKYEYLVNNVTIFLNKAGNIGAEFSGVPEESFSSTNDADAIEQFTTRQ